VISDAERDVQLAARVREHLEPGEEFRAAVWASRADERPPGLTKGELNPFRFRRPVTTGTRRDLKGPPRSLAAGLAEHLRMVTDPRVLALTDRRLLVLSKRVVGWRDVLRPSSTPLPPLRLRWECRRPELTSATEQGGRLRLGFADRSAVTLLTPSTRVQPFLAGVAG
jgi:hypothetical protein